MTAETRAELRLEVDTFETDNPDNITPLKFRNYEDNVIDSFVSVFDDSWIQEGSFADFTTQTGASDIPAVQSTSICVLTRDEART